MKAWYGLITYAIAVVLLIVSFVLPPTGAIDPSVLTASAILIAGYQLMFGTAIKEITIDSNGVHIETHEKNND